MATQTYYDLLKDPRWQKKRLKILERDGWGCLHCDSTTATLHVHHRIYRKGAKPWEYEDELLETLCEACHREYSAQQTALNEAIGKLSYSELNQLLGFAKGLDGWSNGPVPIPFGSAEEAMGIAASLGVTETMVQRSASSGHVLSPEAYESLSEVGRKDHRNQDRRFRSGGG